MPLYAVDVYAYTTTHVVAEDESAAMQVGLDFIEAPDAWTVSSMDVVEIEEEDDEDA